MLKKILIITLSDLRYDARVRRQVQALKQSYDITLAGFNGEPDSEYTLLPLTPTKLTLWRKAITSVFLLLRMYRTAFYILHDYIPYLRNKIGSQDFDLIIANDIETLPIAFALPGKHKVLFDAHEYAPRHFEDKLMWRIFFQHFNIWMCKTFIPRTALMTTVGKALALEYEQHFKKECLVIPNANKYYDLQPSVVLPHQVRLVYVGIANPSRQLELMIDMVEELDERFTLDMYLLIPGFASRKTRSYIDILNKRAGKTGRVKVLPPIKSTELVKIINAYDIGVFLLPPINFNYSNTLPNKLFDFIQARLGIAIGPTPEMAEIVTQYRNGIIAKDFTPSGLANELRKLTSDDISIFKKNSAHAAKVFNAENNATVIQQIVRDIISGSSGHE